MMRRKRIVAVLLAATLLVSGSLAAGATELGEIPADSVPAAEEEIPEEALGTEDAEALDAAVEGQDAPSEAIEAEDTGAAGETDADAWETGRSGEEPSNMKEIAEIDPDLDGHTGEAESGIRTLDSKYTYSYTYTTIDFTKTGDGVSASEVLDKTIEIIVANEGTYDSIAQDDNGSGAMSLGKIQWWADSALTLVRLIVSEDNDTAKSLLGDALYNEITDSSTSWAKRTLKDSEVPYMKAFLNPDNNPASKTVQDKLAESYFAKYLNDGYGLGIRNAAALVYYADIENQYGYTGGSMGGAKACANYAYNIATSWDKVTLNELHLAAITNVAHNYVGRTRQKNYIERRRSTYGKLATCGWTYCNSGDYMIPYDSNGYAGAAWLQAALNAYRGAGLTITGEYDDALKAAVKSYQSAVGLSADGLAGLDTSTKLIYDMYYTSMQTYGASITFATGSSSGSSSGSAAATGATVEKISGVWTYTVNGKADYSYTGFATNSNGKWYVLNGVVDFSISGLYPDKTGAIGSAGNYYYVSGNQVKTSYTGFKTNSSGKWYVVNGVIDFSVAGVYKDTEGSIGAKGTWYYIVGNKVKVDYTGIANYKNENGWWYVVNGAVDFTYTGVAQNKYGWWYTLNGRVETGYTGFAVNKSGKWYCVNGEVDFSVAGVYKDKTGALGEAGAWYYVVGNKVKVDYTGIANYKNENGWWYVVNGKVDFSFTGVSQNKYGTYYVIKGRQDGTYTGTVTTNGITYSVKKGVATPV